MHFAVMVVSADFFEQLPNANGIIASAINAVGFFIIPSKHRALGNASCRLTIIQQTFRFDIDPANLIDKVNRPRLLLERVAHTAGHRSPEV